MADQTIGLPVDGVGKKLDTEELTVASVTVQRERNQVAGAGDVEIARVVNTDPSGTDYALVVREAPAVSPTSDYITSAALAAGASVDLDGTTIASSSVGKLLSVVVSSSVPCKCEVKSRDGAVLVTKAVLFTSGATSHPTERHTPVSKDSVTLAGNGVDENFRVTATNLGTQSLEAADVYVTIEWDEV